MQYKVLLRKTAPESNPEYATVIVEAEDQEKAQEAARKALDDDADKPPGLAWSSVNEPEHWGKAARRVVVSADPL